MRCLRPHSPTQVSSVMRISRKHAFQERDIIYAPLVALLRPWCLLTVALFLLPEMVPYRVICMVFCRLDIQWRYLGPLSSVCCALSTESGCKRGCVVKEATEPRYREGIRTVTENGGNRLTPCLGITPKNGLEHVSLEVETP